VLYDTVYVYNNYIRGTPTEDQVPVIVSE